MRDTVTTLLDAAGLLLAAAGAGAMASAGFLALWRLPATTVAAAGLGALVAGVVVVAGSAFADRRAAPAPRPAAGSEVP